MYVPSKEVRLCFAVFFLCIISGNLFFCQQLIPKEVVKWAVRDFEFHEARRKNTTSGGLDTRSGAPFMTVDSLRARFYHDCENTRNCDLNISNIRPYDRIFVKSDLFLHFMEKIEPQLPGPYVLMVGDGDVSVPDGQTDTVGYIPKYTGSHLVDAAVAKGRLLQFYGTNLWWKDKDTRPRPAYMHCVPYGFHPRRDGAYHLPEILRALKHHLLAKPPIPSSKKTLLFGSFEPMWLKPDRQKAVDAFKHWPGDKFNMSKSISKAQWLESITTHKFTLAPFGHALDTFRVVEILLMGGIPVMRHSTIASCYDDTDNAHFATVSRMLHNDDDVSPLHHTSHLRDTSATQLELLLKAAALRHPSYDSQKAFRLLFQRHDAAARGSLPIVVVQRWSDVTERFLEQKYAEIMARPQSHWDYSRLFVHHWVERIFAN